MDGDQLIVSVSGVRGIVGRGLDAGVARRFGAAFGAYVKGGPVVLSRDSRPSGTMLAAAATEGLLAAGCHVLDCGILPTPSCGIAVRTCAAGGGLLFISIVMFATVAIGTLLTDEKVEEFQAVFAEPAEPSAEATPELLTHLFRWGAVALALAIVAYAGPMIEMLRAPGYLAPGMRTW